jgi:hypothetical protein
MVVSARPELEAERLLSSHPGLGVGLDSASGNAFRDRGTPLPPDRITFAKFAGWYSPFTYPARL